MDTDKAIKAAREASKGILNQLSAKNTKLTSAYGGKGGKSAPTYFVWPSVRSAAPPRPANPSAFPASEYDAAFVQFAAKDCEVPEPAIMKNVSSNTIPSYEHYKTSKGWASEYDASYKEEIEDNEQSFAPGGLSAPVAVEKPAFFAWGLEASDPEAAREVVAPAPTPFALDDVVTTELSADDDASPVEASDPAAEPASAAVAEPEPASQASEYDAAFHWWTQKEIAANKGKDARAAATSKPVEAPMGLLDSEGADKWQSVYDKGTEGQKLPEVELDPDAEPKSAGKPLGGNAQGISRPSNFAWEGLAGPSAPVSDYRAAFTDYGINEVPKKFIPQDEGVKPDPIELNPWCSEYDASFVAKKKSKKAKAVVISEEVQAPAEEVSAPAEESAPEPAPASEEDATDPEPVQEEEKKVEPAKEYTRTPPTELITPEFNLKPARRSQTPKAPTPFENAKVVQLPATKKDAENIANAAFVTEYMTKFAVPGYGSKTNKATTTFNGSNFTGAGITFNQDAPKTTKGPIRTMKKVNMAVPNTKMVGKVSSSTIGNVDYQTSKLDMSSKELSDCVTGHKPKPIPKPVIPNVDRPVRARPNPNKPRTNFSLASNPVLTNRTYPTFSDRGAGRWTSESRSQYQWKKTLTSVKVV